MIRRTYSSGFINIPKISFRFCPNLPLISSINTLCFYHHPTPHKYLFRAEYLKLSIIPLNLVMYFPQNDADRGNKGWQWAHRHFCFQKTVLERREKDEQTVLRRVFTLCGLILCMMKQVLPRGSQYGGYSWSLSWRGAAALGLEPQPHSYSWLPFLNSAFFTSSGSSWFLPASQAQTQLTLRTGLTSSVWWGPLTSCALRKP